VRACSRLTMSSMALYWATTLLRTSFTMDGRMLKKHRVVTIVAPHFIKKLVLTAHRNPSRECDTLQAVFPLSDDKSLED
jgi:hypothetical protein